ncbi:lipid A biosynthesis lauroyl acyltransferase htrB [Candidatus Kinetoplastibacterium desouzaii TCC079E]|uniref:Lipid A biosynthesis lauroyl acyltransferase htrB n=1 Tax=Candidatus Kinetoplastidibacterium desouzai TCC079E TaxID=1208919 RepID=M1LVF0_9PROT|nr:lysophospholipid acyltransferase family protein [Candidatus Kinetoplastibacterium desouzaii]AGF47229.1 lipid A biosynthesis lauroyl acyltransferase htrB [Candidatus Kinetoplastibacterium desouzaii TCC079E]
MLIILCKILAILPLNILQNIGRIIGKTVYLCSKKYRDNIQSNMIKAGFNNQELFRKTAEESGAMILETPKIWFKNKYCLSKTYTSQINVIKQALSEQKGTIFITPHIGCFEIIARHLACYYPITIMFKPPKKKYLESLITNNRNIYNIKAVPANISGVRQLNKALRRKEFIGILPDQVPNQGKGTIVKFFGHEAHAMTLPAKLALQNDSILILAFAERLSKGRGWQIYYERIIKPDTNDVDILTNHINTIIEKTICKIPTQYLWSYDRYKKPSGSINN